MIGTLDWRLIWRFMGCGQRPGRIVAYKRNQSKKKGRKMSQKRIQQIERRIIRVKAALQKIGPMRPGSLTRQYRDPENHTGAYWQISYTRQIKSRT